MTETATATVTNTHRYEQAGRDVRDLHTGTLIGSGSARECDAHWTRQVAAHGTAEAALAAYDAALAQPRHDLSAWDCNEPYDGTTYADRSCPTCAR